MHCTCTCTVRAHALYVHMHCTCTCTVRAHALYLHMHGTCTCTVRELHVQVQLARAVQQTVKRLTDTSAVELNVVVDYDSLASGCISFTLLVSLQTALPLYFIPSLLHIYKWLHVALRTGPCVFHNYYHSDTIIPYLGYLAHRHCLLLEH